MEKADSPTDNDENGLLDEYCEDDEGVEEGKFEEGEEGEIDEGETEEYLLKLKAKAEELGTASFFLPHFSSFSGKMTTPSRYFLVKMTLALYALRAFFIWNPSIHNFLLNGQKKRIPRSRNNNFHW